MAGSGALGRAPSKQPTPLATLPSTRAHRDPLALPGNCSKAVRETRRGTSGVWLAERRFSEPVYNHGTVPTNYSGRRAAGIHHIPVQYSKEPLVMLETEHWPKAVV